VPGMNKPNAFASRFGMQLPVVQGPFGGGLSTPELVAAVSNRGALGSFGAHVTAPGDMGALADSIRKLTSRPFALNLWVSGHDPGGMDFDRAQFERAVDRLAPYYRELGLEAPEVPASTGYRFEEQMQALIEARPPVASFVFGIPSKAVMEKCKAADIATICGHHAR
jgi:nitronate monooxygenase